MQKLNEIERELRRFDEKIGLEELRQLLSMADISRADIADVCIFGEKEYRRNVIACAEAFELLVICWKPGHVSKIHDHDGSNCAFLVIEGAAYETEFQKTSPGLATAGTTRVYHTGEICAGADGYIHQVVNPLDSGTDLITIHIYSPLLKMNIFEIDGGVGELSNFPHVAASNS